MYRGKGQALNSGEELITRSLKSKVTSTRAHQKFKLSLIMEKTVMACRVFKAIAAATDAKSWMAIIITHRFLKLFSE